jgi:hypothetical protein
MITTYVLHGHFKVREIQAAGRRLKPQRARLKPTMDRRLKDYSLAAAGLGALAFAPPAHASITFSTPNLTIPLNSGSPTFAPIPGYTHPIKIVEYSNSGSSGVTVSAGSASPAFFGNSSSGIAPASPGARVPTGLMRFTGVQHLVSSSEGGSNTSFLGSNKYLGFSVGSGANIHYGWMKFTITQTIGVGYTAVLDQLAIEECAAQPITVGATSGGASCPAPPATPAPNSLWLMSLGVAGLAGLETLRRLRKTA